MLYCFALKDPVDSGTLYVPFAFDADEILDNANKYKIMQQGYSYKYVSQV